MKNQRMPRLVALMTLVMTASSSSILGACSLDTAPSGRQVILPSGLIEARPGTPTIVATPGLQDLPANNEFSRGQFFVPSSYRPETAIPLVVLFHDHGARMETMIQRFQPVAEEMGFAFMAINSRGGTWDMLMQGYFGVDRNFVNRALPGVFDRVRIDPNKIGVAGFGSGGSMALGLGMVNGDLFRRIVAFSPGATLLGYTYTGTPDIFITHGTDDPVFSFNATKTVIVPRLQGDNYSVDVREFTGGHEIPPELLREAAAWLVR
jgi:phospholipase/carboxylesterase